MSDKFTTDLRARLSDFIANASTDALSEAFEKANFQGYRHMKESFFGIVGGDFDHILLSASGQLTLNLGLPMSFHHSHISVFSPVIPPVAADHQDLALAA